LYQIVTALEMIAPELKLFYNLLRLVFVTFDLPAFLLLKLPSAMEGTFNAERTGLCSKECAAI